MLPRWQGARQRGPHRHRRQRREPALRLLHSDAGAQPPEDQQPVVKGVAEGGVLSANVGLGTERHIDIGRATYSQSEESRRRHSDDGERLSIDGKRSPYGGWIRREGAAPERIRGRAEIS